MLADFACLPLTVKMHSLVISVDGAVRCEAKKDASIFDRMGRWMSGLLSSEGLMHAGYGDAQGEETQSSLPFA